VAGTETPNTEVDWRPDQLSQEKRNRCDCLLGFGHGRVGRLPRLPFRFSAWIGPSRARMARTPSGWRWHFRVRRFCTIRPLVHWPVLRASLMAWLRPIREHDTAASTVRPMEHHNAYLVATRRHDVRYTELAERLKRKGPDPEGTRAIKSSQKTTFMSSSPRNWVVL